MTDATTTLLDKRLHWKRLSGATPSGAVRIALLSTFTADPLVAYLGVALDRHEIAATVLVGPYGQALGECIDPRSPTAQFAPDVLVVWPSFDDLWAPRPWPLADDLGCYTVALSELVATAVEASTTWAATLLFVLPAIPELRPLGVGDAGNSRGVFAAAASAREEARRTLAATAGVLIADAEEIIRDLGVAAAIDDRRWASARIPYTEAAFDAMGRTMANLLRIERKGARKVVVVDADNTLWGGVVGEDGAGGVDLLDNGPGDAYRSFQRYLVELRRAGMLVGVASRNNESDVWDVFARRDMVLQQAQLVAWRINWEPKADNIEALTTELNVGLSSVVFIDDSAIECAKVAAALPDVATLNFPEDPAQWRAIVAASGRLDRLAPTVSDLARAGSYAVESERRIVRSSMTPEQFLDSLDLHVSIERATADDLGRIAQLIAKTNQFTLDGERRREAELHPIIHDIDRYATCVVSAQDRFGDYGVVGVFIVDLLPTIAVLDVFVLSCRAMGRGIEQAMVAAATAVSNASGLQVMVHHGTRNAPARQFFAGLGAVIGQPSRICSPGWPMHVCGNEVALW